jgi:release factor glutamine methyltransferase
MRTYAPVTLRPARAADAPAIAEMVDAAYGHYVPRIGTRPAPMRADYATVIASQEVTVAEGPSGLVGVAVLAETAEGLCLDNVAVHPAAQGHGVGRALLDQAELAALARGYDSIWLYTHRLMVENRAWYERRGYVEYHQQVEDGYDRVFLRKPLPLVADLRAAGCVFAEDEARLLVEAAAGSTARLAELTGRRVAGEPLEHVVGWVEFAGRRLVVAPGVFVPRQRSMLLVESARVFPGAVVVDLCCGCGALAAGLLGREPRVEVHCADVSVAALDCARVNVPGASTYAGDLFEALPDSLRGRVDVLVANVPYVPTVAIADLPAEARCHEPREALDGGPDGLGVLRRVAADAPSWLAPGGQLLVEIGSAQSDAGLTAFTAAGLAAHLVDDDERGATAIVGVSPQGRSPRARAT